MSAIDIITIAAVGVSLVGIGFALGIEACRRELQRSYEALCKVERERGRREGESTLR